MDKFHQFDFIELIIFDIHCMPKGRLVSKKRIDSVLKNGMGMYSAICFYGMQEESQTHEYFGGNRNFGNQLLYPIPETLTDVLPSAKGKHNVGQVICNLKDFDGSLEMTVPRTVAEKQLKVLADMGYSLKSSFEMEFSIYHADTLKPFGHNCRWSNMRVIGTNEDILLDFITELKAHGISADTLQTEAGTGQFEITLDLDEGLRVADNIARFKNAASIFFAKRNMHASFMTRDQVNGISLGNHFNHSLWTPDGQNVFLDASDPEKLSAIGRHWLAGLITHTKALTALYCPTVNCYRRFLGEWVPTVADWCREKRMSSYRLKVEGKDIYIENRIPSGACNPYLVMAAVTAAGIDGIKRKLSLEDANTSQKLPPSLESALQALEEDKYMVEALGEQFVKLYAFTKRTFEIEPLKAYNGLSDEEKMKKEKEMYFYHC